MERTPKISVVIPVCNVEQYLKECVESVLNQTLKDIEVICVDDGSKDNSLDILRSYEKEDGRVKVIAKQNTGYGNSVNIGIMHCKGTYISIIESDDFIDSHMYEDLLALSDNDTVDVVKGNFWDYYDESGGIGKNVINTERQKVKCCNQKVTLREEPELLWGHPSIWSAIYKREFLEEHNIHFMEEPGGGWVDNPFFFETLLLANSIVWSDKPYYHYRKTNMNSSSNKQTDLSLPLRRMIDNLNVLKKHKCNDKEILRVAYARAFMYLRGLFLERLYGYQLDKIKNYGHKLMKQLNQNVVDECFNARDKKLYYEYLSPLESNIPINGRVLIYNWVQFDNPGKIGGGVNIYCYNLIDTIIKMRPDIQVYFLSSGWAYDATTTDTYIRSTNNVFGNRCRSFEIVNSPVPAAQNMLLKNPSVAIENSKLKELIKGFLQECGHFNVVHFNNIEGLSLDVLDLKQDFVNTKFVFSVHNYIPFCVHGFYYKRHKKCVCTPNHSCHDCEECIKIGNRNDISNEIYLRAVQNVKGKYYLDYEKWISAFGFEKLNKIGDISNYKVFTDTAIEKLNNNMDLVLAVADRVREISIQNGLKEEVIRTSYIGTKVAEYQMHKATINDNGHFKLAYLGSDAYFTEKGYPFLIEMLSSLEDKDASKIDLFLTTTNADIAKIKAKLSKFNSVTIKKGYKHDELREMLKDVHLGVIPVLWEDNLPQIAIEMVAMGVPVLCSSFGGASELCKGDLFKFKGGDIKDFKEKLLYFLNNRDALYTYWEQHDGLVTMEQHWNELSQIWELPECKGVTYTFDDMVDIMKANSFYGSQNWNSDSNNSNDENKLRASNLNSAMIFGLIKKTIHCYKDNGFTYTLNKVLSKL